VNKNVASSPMPRPTNISLQRSPRGRATQTAAGSPQGARAGRPEHQPAGFILTPMLHRLSFVFSSVAKGRL
jgi:hypothetical protein